MANIRKLCQCFGQAWAKQQSNALPVRTAIQCASRRHSRAGTPSLHGIFKGMPPSGWWPNWPSAACSHLLAVRQFRLPGQRWLQSSHLLWALSFFQTGMYGTTCKKVKFFDDLLPLGSLLAPVLYLGYILNWALPYIRVSSSVVYKLLSFRCQAACVIQFLFVVFQTSPCLHNGPSAPTPCPSAQNMGCLLGSVGGRICCLFLLCSLEVALVSRVWSAWASALWSLACCQLSPALCLPQCRSCPCTSLLEHFAPPPPPPGRQSIPLPRFSIVLWSAVCKMPSCLACLHPIFSGMEPALRPRLVCSFSCYRVQIALHPGFLSFDLL